MGGAYSAAGENPRFAVACPASPVTLLSTYSCMYSAACGGDSRCVYLRLARHVPLVSHSSPSVLSISTSAVAFLFDDTSTSIAAAANGPALPRPPPPPSSSSEAAIVESSAPSSQSPAKRASSKTQGLQTRQSAHVDDIVCLMTAIASSCTDNIGSNVSSGVGGTVSCLAALHRLIIALPPPPSVFPHASSLVQCLFCHALSQVLCLSSSSTTSTNVSEPLLPNAQHITVFAMRVTAFTAHSLAVAGPCTVVSPIPVSHQGRFDRSMLRRSLGNWQQRVLRKAHRRVPRRPSHAATTAQGAFYHATTPLRACTSMRAASNSMPHVCLVVVSDSVLASGRRYIY